MKSSTVSFVLWLELVTGVICVEHAFTSMHSMEGLVHIEGKVIRTLDNIITQKQLKIELLKSFLKTKRCRSQFGGANQKLKGDTGFVSVPVKSHHVKACMTKDWSVVQNVTSASFNVTKLREELDLPTTDDLEGAALALSRLHDTYKLNASDLGRGIIRGAQYSQPMTAYDAFELGRMMYNSHEFHHAVIWFQLAVELNAKENGTDPLQATSRSLIIDYLSFSLYKTGDIGSALEWTEKFLKLEPHCVRNKRNRQNYIKTLSEKKEKLKTDNEMEKPLDTYNKDAMMQKNFKRLCRGEAKVDHRLVCRYVDNGNPYLRVGKVKMEEKHLDPFIVVFYDVIFDTEVEKIIEIARPVITRSKVTRFSPGQNAEREAWFDRERVSQTAFLRNNDPVLFNVNRRAGILANLTEKSSEDLQVLNYGIGGHYGPHVDYSLSTKPDRGFPEHLGNRMTTLLFYMTDVEHGGATVFPWLDVAVFPKKGSALLWHNLFRDGEGDNRTCHGSCPVLIGSKWACNKWFHEGMQEFRRPCQLKQDSKLIETKLNPIKNELTQQSR